MSSLVSLRVIKERLESEISSVAEEIDRNRTDYTQGPSPKPLPIVKYYDIEFRSFVNEVRRVLSTISGLFGILAGKAFDNGNFHKALEWAKAERGPDAVLTMMLDSDQHWLKLWIDVRIAIEHPKKDKYVETLNFSLEPNRGVRLPTWRFVHPDYDIRDVHR
jgi:hypothetical protein